MLRLQPIARGLMPVVGLASSPFADRALVAVRVLDKNIQDFNQDIVTTALKSAAGIVGLGGAIAAGSIPGIIAALATVADDPLGVAVFVNNWVTFKAGWEAFFGANGGWPEGASPTTNDDIFSSARMNASFNAYIDEYGKLWHAFTDPSDDGGLNFTTSAHAPFSPIALLTPDEPAPAAPPLLPAPAVITPPDAPSDASDGSGVVAVLALGVGLATLFAFKKK